MERGSVRRGSPDPAGSSLLLFTDHGPLGLGGRRVGDVIRLDLAGLVGGRDDQTEFFQPGQALDDGGARQLRAPHEPVEADRHALVGYTATGFNHGQIDLDGLATNPSQVAPVEKDRLDPIVLHALWHGGGHDGVISLGRRLSRLAIRTGPQPENLAVGASSAMTHYS